MANILVLYYSLTGNTEQVARSLAAKLPADLEPLRDAKKRGVGLSHLGTVMQVLFKTPARIMPVSMSLSDYDLVVLGAPVWAGDMAAPMRTLLKTQGRLINKLAVFCTEQGSGGEGALRKMEALCGKTAVAAMVVLEKEVRSGAWDDKADPFIGAIREAVGGCPDDRIRQVV